jgi:hypothetical protein
LVLALSIKNQTSHVLSFTGVLHEAKQEAHFADGKWGTKHIHDFANKHSRFLIGNIISSRNW